MEVCKLTDLNLEEVVIKKWHIMPMNCFYPVMTTEKEVVFEQYSFCIIDRLLPCPIKDSEFPNSSDNKYLYLDSLAAWDWIITLAKSRVRRFYVNFHKIERELVFSIRKSKNSQRKGVPDREAGRVIAKFRLDDHEEVEGLVDFLNGLCVGDVGVKGKTITFKFPVTFSVK